MTRTLHVVAVDERSTTRCDGAKWQTSDKQFASPCRRIGEKKNIILRLADLGAAYMAYLLKLSGFVVVVVVVVI